MNISGQNDCRERWFKHVKLGFNWVFYSFLILFYSIYLFIYFGLFLYFYIKRVQLPRETILNGSYNSNTCSLRGRGGKNYLTNKTKIINYHNNSDDGDDNNNNEWVT